MDLLSSKFSGRCEKRFHRKFRRSTTKIYWMNTTIFPFDHILYQACFMPNVMGKVVGVTILNILRIARAMLMNSCIVNTPRCRILILGAKYFACFSRFLLLERLFQKWTALRNQTPPHLQHLPSPLSYSGVIRVKKFVLKHWVLL